MGVALCQGRVRLRRDDAVILVVSRDVAPAACTTAMTCLPCDSPRRTRRSSPQVDKTEGLQQVSLAFRREARRLKHTMWWKVGSVVCTVSGRKHETVFTQPRRTQAGRRCRLAGKCVKRPLHTACSCSIRLTEVLDVASCLLSPNL